MIHFVIGKFHFQAEEQNEDFDILPQLSFADGNEDDVAVVEMVNESVGFIQVETIREDPQKKKHEWITEAIYNDLEEAIEHLEEKGFILHVEHDLKCGQKFHFRCKCVPKLQKPWCNRQHILFCPSNKLDTYIIQHNNLDHNCHELMADKKKKLSDEMKEYTFELFNSGVEKYNTLLALLEKEKENGTFESPD